MKDGSNEWLEAVDDEPVETVDIVPEYEQKKNFEKVSYN